MKNKKTKIIVALLAVVCFAILGLFQIEKTEAADPTYVVESYAISAAQDYFTNDNAPTCNTEGYIFAGWYAASDSLTADETTGESYFAGYPLSTLDGYQSETVQALFVENTVLDVKAQVAVQDGDNNSQVATVGDANTCLRFVTSVDSNKYAEVGFKVSYTYNGTLFEKESVTDYVYKQLTVADGTDGGSEAESVSPSEVFSKRSQYFKACIVSSIPKAVFDMDFSVRTFWKTVDGAIVYGSSEPVTKTVIDGINNTYEASVGDIYYKVLETAVNTVGTGTANVTLIKNAEVASEMVITGNVTVTNREGANITIYRSEGLTASSVFAVSEGATLTINGTTGMDSIVLDGRTSKLADVVATKQMVTSTSANLNITNATLRNASYKKDTSWGSAIAITKGKLNATDAKFISNTGSRGGAAIFGTTVESTITNCQFGGNETTEGNSGSRRGGAIYILTSSTMTISDSEFINNSITTDSTTDGDGGAILNRQSELKIYNTKFYKNTARTNGGAISHTNSGSTTIIAENSKGDSSLAVMEGNQSGKEGGAVYVGSGTFNVTGYEFIANSSETNGGAILAGGTSTITNCIFGGDEETKGNSASQRGGALFAPESSTVTVSDSEFLYNITKTYDGGAIAGKQANLTIDNTKFYTNTAKTNGGAVSVTDSSTLTLSAENDEGNSSLAVIEGNRSGKEGGAVYVGSGTSEFTGYKFIANSANTYGGAILAGGTSTITNVECTENHSVKEGGAVYAYENVTITGSAFEGNYTTGSGGHGGAVYVHKQANKDHSTSIESSTFTNNYTAGSDTYGGAVCIAVNGWLKLDETNPNTYTGNYQCGDETNASNEPYQLVDESAYYSQNFNDIEDGSLPTEWAFGIDTGGTAKVIDGKLYMQSTDATNPVLVLDYLPDTNNYAVEFDVSFKSTVDNNTTRWASLVFDYNEDTYWHVSLRRKGTGNIDLKTIATNKWNPTNALGQLIEAVDLEVIKHIRIEFNDNTLKYYIDGNLMTYTIDEIEYSQFTLSPTRGNGKLGLACCLSEVYFDNFVIKELETETVEQ